MIDHCKYCSVQMDTVGLGFANGWRCPICGHVEIDSASVDNMQPSKSCTCNNCIKEIDKYHLCETHKRCLSTTLECSEEGCQIQEAALDLEYVQWRGEGKLIFHGGCLNCIAQTDHGLDYCLDCRYFDYDKEDAIKRGKLKPKQLEHKPTPLEKYAAVCGSIAIVTLLIFVIVSIFVYGFRAG